MDVTYGAALSDTQLDATASVPGTFIYTPPSGTILNVGQNQPLNVSFTPTDTANYTTASVAVPINITKKTPKIAWNDPSSIIYGTKLSNAQLDASA